MKYTMVNVDGDEVIRTEMEESKMGRYASRTKNSYNHKALRARERRNRTRRGKHGS